MAGRPDYYKALGVGKNASQEDIKKAYRKLARELLPALDNLSRALAAAQAPSDDAGERHLAEGIKLVHDDLVAALERVGIEAYSPVGEPFDPELHEAMAQQPAEDAESGTVLQVYQQGFRINGQILRPARVVVAQ